MMKVAVISFIALQCIWMVFAVWIPKEKLYYIQNGSHLSREDASKYCQKLGMELLSVKSQTEFQQLKDYIRNKYGYIYPYWIGAYKDGNTWKWSAYNEVIESSETMWHENQPDNTGGNERCVHTWQGDFDWNDNDCRVVLPFICELQLNVLPKGIKVVTLTNKGIRIA